MLLFYYYDIMYEFFKCLENASLNQKGRKLSLFKCKSPLKTYEFNLNCLKIVLSFEGIMSGNRRPDLPTRSVSLDNLRPKSNLRKRLKFIDDTPTRSSSSASGSPSRGRIGSDELLSDLNNILRAKLRIVNPMMDSERKGSTSRDNQADFKARLGLEGNVLTTEFDNGEDEEVDAAQLDHVSCQGDEQESDEMGDDEDEEDEDEEFANVDEIDGPISGKKTDNLEDSKSDMDYNMPVDEEYKRSLDERAAEFDEVPRFQPISQPRIEWDLMDHYSLKEDLGEWFCASDFSQLPQTKSQFEKIIEDPIKFTKDEDYARGIITKLCQDAQSNILALTYISMGTYALVDNVDCQLQNIRRNNLLICLSLADIVAMFKRIAKACRDDVKNLKKQTALFFYASTIIFSIVNVCIEQRDYNPTAICNAIETFHESHLLSFLTRYIEHWRWNSRLSMRIRSMINLLFKLMVLQFGDKTVWESTKTSIYDLHNLKRSTDSDKAKKLRISPLHYQAFREDIISRFPDYPTPRSGLPAEVDNSNSLSQFLEIPRSKARNPISLTLATPQQHIATPASSPPDTPNIMQMCDTIRHRKSFQTNMAFPCLYPSDDEEGEDPLTRRMSLDREERETEVVVPYSVQEATRILSGSVHITLSVQQLWYERDLFVSTERGWKMNHDQDRYNYAIMENTKNEEALDVMKRVDSFYNECFSAFNSLVFVLLQTMESNLSNIDYKSAEISPDTKIDSLIPRLEMNRARKLAMKSSVGILCLMLKWFKLNHILKYEHLCMILYDSRYIHTCCTLLGKYSENYSDRVLNRMLLTPLSIWRECSNYSPDYQQSFKDQEQLENKQYNIVMLTSIGYMLRVLRKIVGNKTERLKELPLNIGLLFKRYYRIFNLDIYHPILKIIKELTPFKNKRWKSEHMELISGVFLYEKLELLDNWVTGKDVTGELGDACGQEIAMRALLQFYNFLHYEKSMEDLGYSERSNSNLSLLNKESEYLGM